MADEKSPVAAPVPSVKAASTEPVKAKDTRPFSFSGYVGLPFAIYGEGFEESGTLTIGGEAVVPSKWSDKVIKGFVPAHLKSGKTVVKVNDRSVDAVI